MKHLRENNSLADQYKEWLTKEKGVKQHTQHTQPLTTEEHRELEIEFESILKPIFMAYVEENINNFPENFTENLEWYRVNYDAQKLADFLIEEGYENGDEVINAIKNNFKDRNGVPISIGDVVIFTEEPYDDGHEKNMELTINDIVTDNLGCFTTDEFDSRYFSFTEVEKKD